MKGTNIKIFYNDQIKQKPYMYKEIYIYGFSLLFFLRFSAGNIGIYIYINAYNHKDLFFSI